MTQKKAQEVARWLSQPDPRMRIVLIYGPDRGLVSERARMFVAKLGLALDDPFSVVRFDAEDIELSPGRLIDEARTVAMFAAERLIWLRNAAGGQKGLADAVRLLIAEPPQDAILLIEAGDLKKSVPLRTAIEGGARAIALPCYADEGRAIDALMDEELGKAGLSISLEARRLLREALGGDRLASRGELEKLVLYCAGRRSVVVEDILASIGDVAGFSFDDAVDAMLLGDLGGLDRAFSRLTTGMAAPALLLSAMRQLHSLQEMHNAIEAGGQSPSGAIATARPPIFFARRQTIEAALRRWTGASLQRGLQRLQTAILQTRQHPHLAVSVTRQTLLALALEVARAR